MNGLGLKTRRLGHALGSPAGGSAQEEPCPLGCENAQDAFNNRGLADAGTAGEDQNFGHQRESDRGSLAFRKGKPDTLLDPWQCLVRIDPGPRGRAIRKPQQPLGDGALRPIQPRQKHAACFADAVGDNYALGQFEIECGTDEFYRHLEQLFCKRHELIRRQAAMPLVHGLGQRIRDAGAHPDHRHFFDSELHRDGVGGFEADAADVTRQAIWVLRHDLHGISAVGLVDAHRPGRADAVAVKEDHDLAHDLLLGPGSGDTASSYRTNARHFPQPLWLHFDRIEHLLAKGANELLGVDRADAADHPGPEILFDTIERSRFRGLEKPCLELLPMSAVIDPFA